MSEPRVFISSTYGDLHETRKQVNTFIEDYGFKSVSFEENDITYEPNKTLEESCYEEVKDCSMFVLLIKSDFGKPSSIKSIKGIKLPEEVKSVTQLEYLFARKLGIPIFVFVYKSSLDEYYSYEKTGFSDSFNFNYLNGKNHADFLRELFRDKAIRYINEFNSTSEIIQVLKKQWAGLFNLYLTRLPIYKANENQEIYINPFKFFFFRRNIGLSQNELSSRTGIAENTIREIEDAGMKKSRVEITDFKQLTLRDAEILSDELSCSVGNIKAGLPDDFLSQYLSYYMRNKGVQHRLKKDERSLALFKTRAIVFDFDGTLTKPNDGLTSWEKIWLKLGYDLDECGELHAKFSRTELTHKKWCQITEEKFIERNLSKAHLDEISKDIKLLPNAYEVLKELAERDINLYICSGSIDYIIKKVLGESAQFFDEIKSNKFKFDRNNKLKLS